jgi:hypothetical protein
VRRPTYYGILTTPPPYPGVNITITFVEGNAYGKVTYPVSLLEFMLNPHCIPIIVFE